MSFDPGSIVTLIQTCQTLYDYYRDVKQSSVERSRLLVEVLSLQSALEALQRLVDAGGPASTEQVAQLLGSSQPFFETLQKTLNDVEAVLRNGMFKSKANSLKVAWRRLTAALWWTTKKAEVKSLLCDIKRQKSRIMIALQHDIFQKQNDLSHHLSNEDRLKMAAFISPSDFAGHRTNLFEERLPGTGIWMLQHPKFVAWRDNEGSPRTLWCYGHPGAGKSVMAALIVHLQSRSNIVLSVFCRYTSDNLKTPFPVLRGLLRQLIEKTTGVPSTICELYWTKTIPGPNTLPDLLTEVAAIHAQPIYIVIDALDECKIALDLLHAVQQLGPLFRILITSRPIFREIHETPSIQIRASNDDILIAINTTLSKLKHVWLDETLRDMIRAQIIDKADGMFLLASLQLRELERDVTCRRDVVAILDSLPRTLDEAYKLTYQRIREQGERTNELVCRTLAIVSLGRIALQDMRDMLAEGDVNQYTDIETILQCCHGLVGLLQYTSKPVFAHYSMYEYTTAHWSELFPENPDRSLLCLKMAYLALIASPDVWPAGRTQPNNYVWHLAVGEMEKPEELNQVIFYLSTPAAMAKLVQCDASFAPLVHDPLLIACYVEGYSYYNLIKYITQTAPPDVQRFTEAIRVSRRHHDAYSKGRDCLGLDDHCVFIAFINARPDMRVNSDGVVVTVDPSGGDEDPRLRDTKDDERPPDDILIQRIYDLAALRGLKLLPATDFAHV